MGRRAEPTLTEPRFPNNEPRLEIRGSVWRLLLAILVRIPSDVLNIYIN